MSGLHSETACGRVLWPEELLRKLAGQGHFVSDDDVAEIAKVHRLEQLLVRCGNGRFMCAAQDVTNLIAIIRHHDRLFDANAQALGLVSDLRQAVNLNDEQRKRIGIVYMNLRSGMSGDVPMPDYVRDIGVPVLPAPLGELSRRLSAMDAAMDAQS